MAAAGSAGAAEVPAFISAVAISGSLASPTVTVTGTGFGSIPKHGVAVASITSCTGQSGTGAQAGMDYPKGELWVSDATAGWSGGHFSGQASSNCIGVNISSWSPTQVVFTLGDGYGGTSGLGSFRDGDGVVVSVKGAPGPTVVSGLS